MSSTPPILSLPLLTTGEGGMHGQPKARLSLLDPACVPLPTHQLSSCVSELSIQQLLPFIRETRLAEAESSPSSPSLPLVIREKDVRYQLSRATKYISNS